MGPVQEARDDPVSFLEQGVAVFHSEREIILGMNAARGNLKGTPAIRISILQGLI